MFGDISSQNVVKDAYIESLNLSSGIKDVITIWIDKQRYADFYKSSMISNLKLDAHTIMTDKLYQQINKDLNALRMLCTSHFLLLNISILSAKCSIIWHRN